MTLPNLAQLVVLAHREAPAQVASLLGAERPTGPAAHMGPAVRNLAAAITSPAGWADARVLLRHAAELEALGATDPSPVVALTLPPSVRRDLSAALQSQTIGTREAVRRIFQAAQTEIIVLAPYTHETVVADVGPLVADATRRGVRVRIVAESRPGAAPDLFFATLREYNDEAGRPGLLETQSVTPIPSWTAHAKIVVADGRIALVGSGNLTARALLHNLEAGVLVSGAPARTLLATIEAFLSAVQVRVHA